MKINCRLELQFRTDGWTEQQNVQADFNWLSKLKAGLKGIVSLHGFCSERKRGRGENVAEKTRIEMRGLFPRLVWTISLPPAVSSNVKIRIKEYFIASRLVLRRRMGRETRREVPWNLTHDLSSLRLFSQRRASQKSREEPLFLLRMDSANDGERGPLILSEFAHEIVS